MPIETHNDLRTADIVLAATLLSLNLKLKEIKVDRTRGVFCFDQVPLETLLQFDLDKILVEPKKFNHHIKSLTTSCRRMIQQ